MQDYALPTTSPQRQHPWDSLPQPISVKSVRSVWHISATRHIAPPCDSSRNSCCSTLERRKPYKEQNLLLCHREPAFRVTSGRDNQPYDDAKPLCHHSASPRVVGELMLHDVVAQLHTPCPVLQQYPERLVERGKLHVFLQPSPWWRMALGEPFALIVEMPEPISDECIFEISILHKYDSNAGISSFICTFNRDFNST